MEANNKIGGTISRKLTETEIVILVAIVGMYSGLVLAIVGTILK